MTKTSKRILLTGSQGQIGCALCKPLADLGFDVHRLDRLPGSSDRYLSCDLVKDDLKFLRDMKIDVVIHLAGDKSDPPESLKKAISAMQTNVLGTLRLLESIGTAATQIIYASSISVYGDSRVPYREEQPLMPRTLYGASKAAAEAFLSHYQNKTSAVCILRIAQVVGPQTPPHVAPLSMIESGVSGKLVLNCTEKTIRDYVHMQDVVNAIISTIRRKARGIFNIGSGRPTSLVDLANYIAGITGALIEHVPSAATECAIWMAIEKARISLDYEPTWTIEDWVGAELGKRKEIRYEINKWTGVIEEA